METFVSIRSLSRKERYEEIIPQITALIEGEADLIANLANTTAALKMALKDEASWLGFYLNKENELVLGPFQGKPACVRIEMGRGVCGTAVLKKQTIIVPDVSKFPGHIYCDPDSKSEIVVPLLRQNAVLGVLDVDSSILGSFDDTDKHYLERIAALLVEVFPQSVH